MRTETKLFEVRDKATYMPFVATKIITVSADEQEQYILGIAGWRTQDPLFFTNLTTGETQQDPYGWPSSARTVPNAHQYVIDNWDALASGDVVCVEHILGERDTPKTPERLDRL